MIYSASKTDNPNPKLPGTIGEVAKEVEKVYQSTINTIKNSRKFKHF